MTTKVFCFLIFIVPRLMAKLLEDPTCGDNEYYDDCGSYCQATCQIPEPHECPPVCLEGCFCETGFLREHVGGECIPKDTCEGSCRDHEVYNSCGTSCPRTCYNPDPICDLRDCANGCFCEDGYILDTESSQMCIREDQCPKGS